MWLKNLTGFDESKEAIYKNIMVKDGVLTSKINNKSYHYGTLEIPTLKELRERVAKSNKNALFQVALQFNLLEMVGSNVTLSVQGF